MLKKQNRLSVIRKNTEDAFFSSPLFNIAISGGNETNVRFGFVVSKKISKKAVVRNRTKRVLQYAAGSMLTKIKPGNKITLIAKKELDFLQKEETENTLKELLIKAKLVK